MKAELERIGKILAAWNPIGVPESLAYDEYKCYIPVIMESIGSEDALRACLINILENRIGLYFDENNLRHLGDLNLVCARILISSDT